MTTIFIALGSNLGDREGNLRAAVAALREAGIVIRRGSSIWQTAPIPANQPAYLNATVAAETTIGPQELLAVLKRIEQDLGRMPTWRWGPRTIDLDILFYGELTIETPDLTIPHPRIAERGFVLAPLAQVLDGPLPILGASARELLAGVGVEGLQDTGSPLLAA